MCTKGAWVCVCVSCSTGLCVCQCVDYCGSSLLRVLFHVCASRRVCIMLWLYAGHSMSCGDVGWQVELLPEVL
jgi:hypothetical protein